MREEIRREVDEFCSEFGYSLAKVEARIASIKEYEDKEYLSLIYFTLISFTQKRIKNILEIGTYRGSTTRMLSRLFPEALVNTIDLPAAIIRKRIGLKYLRARKSIEFKENTGRDNVRFFDSDSFFLASLDLPREFDLIYVDGSHMFPAIAWDIAYSYAHLSSGGFMIVHDCHAGNDVKKAIAHMAKIVDGVRLLPFDYENPEKKIAYVRKKEDIERRIE